MKKTKDGDRVAASLFIYDAAKMSPAGRRRIARWLKRQMEFVLKFPKQLSPRFRARYLYSD
jgi:hypothetical protein